MAEEDYEWYVSGMEQISGVIVDNPIPSIAITLILVVVIVYFKYWRNR
ncbi:hypothetical protein LCGC14_0176570 [marine sediment metagenome]|uniref:Uncharacterized protein n=1 Tax=marine sediment metagenome TaxID=412755 RepID=A0A0F9XU17_9ZZZZ